jgi:hypothetical protein
MLAREMFERQRQPNRLSPSRFDQDEPEDELSDADFARELRADIEGVQAGLVSAGSEDAHPVRQQRPFSPKRKRRDRFGRAF